MQSAITYNNKTRTFLLLERFHVHKKRHSSSWDGSNKQLGPIPVNERDYFTYFVRIPSGHLLSAIRNVGHTLNPLSVRSNQLRGSPPPRHDHGVPIESTPPPIQSTLVSKVHPLFELHFFAPLFWFKREFIPKARPCLTHTHAIRTALFSCRAVPWTRGGGTLPYITNFLKQCFTIFLPLYLSPPRSI